jgi:hypothetical protein
MAKNCSNCTCPAEEKKRCESLVQKIAGDVDGFEKFLVASPFDGEYQIPGLTEGFFLRHLYADPSPALDGKGKRVAALHQNILAQKNLSENAIYVTGYMRTGKSTYVHALLEGLRQEWERMGERPDSFDSRCLFIACDRYKESEHKSMKRVLSLALSNALVIDGHISDFYSFASVSENGAFIESLDLRLASGQKSLSGFCRLLQQILNQRKRQSSESRAKRINGYISELEAWQLLALLTLALICQSHRKPDSPIPYFLVIDNIDYIEEHSELKDFFGSLEIYKSHMKSGFPKLKIGGKAGHSFKDRVILILALREYNLSLARHDHPANPSPALEMNGFYSPSDISERRVALLNTNRSLLEGSQREKAKLWSEIASDSYFSETMAPLFNGNYLNLVSALSDRMSDSPAPFSEYSRLMKEKRPIGAHGILINEFVHNLLRPHSEECLEKMGVSNLRPGPLSPSICRIILSALSCQQEYIGGQLYQKPTQLGGLVEAIAGALKGSAYESGFSAEKIRESVWMMYNFKSGYDWSHLVTFFSLKSRTGSMLNAEDVSEESELLLTDAGRLYLETIAHHFEFFSARAQPVPRPSLFCRSNLESGSYRAILESVLSTVENVCRALALFNRAASEGLGVGSPYDSKESREAYKATCFVGSFRNTARKAFDKQFHESRIITTHIRYIDEYRRHALSHDLAKAGVEEKIQFNRTATEALRRYAALLSADGPIQALSGDSAPLVEEYFHNIGKIASSEYRDFETGVDRQGALAPQA